MAAFKAIRRQTTLFVQAAADIQMLPRSSTLRPHRVLERHADWVSSLAFSPDEIHMATGSGDGTVLIWDLQTGSHTDLGGHTGFIRSVSFSPDGQRVATGGYDSRIRIWDISSRALLCALSAEHDSRAVAFSPDGRQVASVGDESVKIWDVTTSCMLHSLDDRGHWTLAYAPDGNMLACGSGKSIIIWVPQSNSIYELLGHAGPVLSVAFSPFADQLISGSADGTIRRWSIKTRESIGEPLTGHIGTVLSVAISPNGQMIASSGQDKTLRLWNASTGKPIGRVLPHPDWVRCVKFSPSGKSIATACDDKKVRLWYVHMCTKTLSRGSEKEMGDRLRDSVSDGDDPLTLIPERVISGNPTSPFTTSILSSLTSTQDLPSTMLPKEQAQTQSGNDRMSGVPSGVPPQLQEPVALPSMPPPQDSAGKRKKKISTWVLRVVFHRFRGGKRRSVAPSSQATPDTSLTLAS
ncbi:WD40 repeat-like protein [Rhizopogon salebrosus TDB-379]|nr:WD40 repeat-like protein [Rhizopogon salebrosus TDB-379]